jgi:hypothetical protein
VLQELHKLGKKVFILDMSSFGRSVSLTQIIGSASCVKSPLSALAARSDEIEAVWLRRPGRIDLTHVVSEEHLEFALREWRDSFWGWLDSLPARFISPLVAQERATKPLQLQLANEIGLRTPATCITNCVHEFSEFVAKFDGRVVHKSLTQPKSMLMDTRAWSPSDSQFLSELPLVPTMVQERIFGPEDVRLTVIGKEVFAAKMRTPMDVVDSRLVKELPYEPWSIPAGVAEKILRLMDRLGLAFGTVDLKMSEDGDLVFLEVNPQGQFICIEIITGLPLLHSFATFLAGL